MRYPKRLLRALLPLTLLAGLFAGLAGPHVSSGRAAPLLAPGAGVVISEFRTVGPNGNADEFIEIFNRSASSVNIGGWELRGLRSDLQLADSLATVPNNTTLVPGAFWLIANEASDLASTDDQSYTAEIVNDGGIALLDAGDNRVDSVAMANNPTNPPTSPYLEGTPLAPMPDPNTAGDSYQRDPSGCTDSDNNAADFGNLAAPTPQNSGSAPSPCATQIFTTSIQITGDSPDPSLVNAAYAVNFTLTINGTGGPAPTGNVVVSDGTDTCTAPAAAGAGSCSLTSTTTGNKSLTAVYAGDDAHFSSTSLAVTHVVNASPNPATLTPTASRTPQPGFLSVVINEVAWAGTRANADHEWIELYNPTTRDIDLTGWYIQVTSFDRIIDLDSNILKAGTYYLIERAQAATTVPADQVTEWELLEDNFEILTLYAPGQRLIDQTYATRNRWPAGNTNGARSMERRQTNTTSALWVTYAGTPTGADPKDEDGVFIYGTPGRANWNIPITLTPSPTPTRFGTRVPTRTPPPQPRPVINEFLPRAAIDWNRDGRVDVLDEFVEVANLGPVDWNTNGWRLDTGDDSEPFTLPALTVRPGERAIFYGIQSGLRLLDGGATVRLLNSGGRVYDAQTYTVVKTPDKSWCRIRDLSGSWFDDCFPTPNQVNSREGDLPAAPPGTGLETPLCRLSDTLPEAFRLAECSAYGANMWNSRYWDLPGWGSALRVLQNGSKGEVFIE